MNKRVTTVQVPGEEPKPVATPTPTPATAAPAPATSGSAPANEAPAPTSAPAPATAPTLDIEALRAQIRAEEMGKLRAELTQQIEVASSVVGKSAAAAPRQKADYRTMRAADIDPATLTAPVMTLDGYLCPPAPEAKK